ncbi:MAG: sulfatase family protein [Planctomycetota bacterium]|jgi:choline-sulfatase
MPGRSLTRRDFIKVTGGLAAGSGAALIASGGTTARARARPNILFLLTDQQSATMLGCAGNRWVKTPAMDSLMRRGMRFEKAYAANPVCVPSRFSLLTGHYPSAIKLRKNGQGKGSERFVSHALGHVFKRAGYETVYGGKVHLPGALRNIEKCGFRRLTGDQRDELARRSAAFLRGKHEKPFLLVASFINPHDICYQAILASGSRMGRGSVAVRRLREAERLPDGMSRQEFFRDHCPPAPANLDPTDPEPEAMQVALKDRAFRKWARENWTEQDWRRHRWAYARLTERVDRQVGEVLAALREAGLEDDTIVVFTSDHGDMDAAHRLEHKSMAYEESARIPMLVQYPGVTKAGHVDKKHLVSNGLDLLPTLCDLAGVALPEGLRGRSIKPLLGGDPAPGWRTQLMIETQFSTAVTDGRYKYTLFDAAGPEEMLCDLGTDPGEMKNLAALPEHSAVLNRMRKALREEAGRHGVKVRVPE